MDKGVFYNWLGSMCGRFYNAHQAWEQAPTWMKEHYKIETEQHCGDIDGIFSAAMKQLLKGYTDYAKDHPITAAQMGLDTAKKLGITVNDGFQFSSGFLSTANLLKE